MFEKIIIKDNFLKDIDLLSYLHEYVKIRTPHYLAQVSNPQTTMGRIENNQEPELFYITRFPFDESYGESPLRDSKVHKDKLIDFIYFKIKLFTEQQNINIEKIRTYANIQHHNQEGDWHDDDGDLTAMLMLSPTNHNGGSFEYKDKNDNIKSVDFVQNRLIIFPAHLQHRGRAPNNSIPRITLAFKTEIYD